MFLFIVVKLMVEHTRVRGAGGFATTENALPGQTRRTPLYKYKEIMNV
jgi:hypothetical protein